MGGYVVDGCKAAVVYLLVTAHLIQRNELNLFGIVEISYPRIVERDMCVLTNAEKYDIGGILGKKIAISLALCFGIGVVTANVVNFAKRKLAEYVLIEVVAKALFLFLGETNVLINMESTAASPIDVGLLEQSRKSIVLRRSCCKNDVYPFLLCKQFANSVCTVACSILTCKSAVFKNFNGQFIFNNLLQHKNKTFLFCIYQTGRMRTGSVLPDLREASSASRMKTGRMKSS